MKRIELLSAVLETAVLPLNDTPMPSVDYIWDLVEWLGMVKIVREPIEGTDLENLAKEIGGFYIKVVVDLEREILCAGARMHVDEEKALLDDGSVKENLWGGGYEIEEGLIRFDSMINIKPGVNDGNEIGSLEIKKKFEQIVRRLFKL